MTTNLNENNDCSQNDAKGRLMELAELTGFPANYIKKELVLDSDNPSMDDLRESMLTFLKSTMEK